MAYMLPLKSYEGHFIHYVVVIKICILGVWIIFRKNCDCVLVVGNVCLARRLYWEINLSQVRGSSGDVALFLVIRFYSTFYLLLSHSNEILEHFLQFI